MHALYWSSSDSVKDTCAAWGLDQLTYGEGVVWRGKDGHASAYI